MSFIQGKPLKKYFSLILLNFCISHSLIASSAAPTSATKNQRNAVKKIFVIKNKNGSTAFTALLQHIENNKYKGIGEIWHDPKKSNFYRCDVLVNNKTALFTWSKAEMLEPDETKEFFELKYKFSQFIEQQQLNPKRNTRAFIIDEKGTITEKDEKTLLES